MGRILIAAILVVLITLLLIGSVSTGLISKVSGLTRLGRFVLAVLLCAVGAFGYFYVQGGVGYLFWLYSVPARPQAELTFVSRSEEAMQVWRASTTRGPQECHVSTRALQKLAGSVTDWYGTVSTIYRVGDSVAIVVRIGRYSQFRTSYMPANDAVLIDKGTSVFAQSSDLKSGDAVRFSGAFSEQATTCAFERTSHDADWTVDMLFKFTSIERR